MCTCLRRRSRPAGYVYERERERETESERESARARASERERARARERRQTEGLAGRGGGRERERQRERQRQRQWLNDTRTHMLHDCRAKSVTHDVADGTHTVESPVNGEDDGQIRLAAPQSAQACAFPVRPCARLAIAIAAAPLTLVAKQAQADKPWGGVPRIGPALQPEGP